MDVEELVHVHGGEAGVRRERQGDRFAYRDAEGERVTDPETLARIAALKIPPAWTDVWIAAAPNASDGIGAIRSRAIDATATG